MIPTEFFVPTRDNSGQPFSAKLWRDLHQRLIFRFGGLSAVGGHRGAWVSGGHVYRDDNVQFSVDLATWQDFPDWLEIVRQVRIDFRQIAVRIQVAGIPEIIEDPPTGSARLLIVQR